MTNHTEHNKTKKISVGNTQERFHAPQGLRDNSHLIVFINGTEDDLSSILGNLELGVSDRGPVVQDHDYVLGLWSDRRDVDGPRERKRVLTQL